MQQVNLGMMGGGTVGSGVFHAWQKNGGLMAARLGVKISFRKIAVKAFDELRPYPIPRALMTTDWQEVVNDPDIHVVIELVGGTGIAKVMVLAALAQGKTVVTANKALISACGPELFAAAAKHGANLYYEASVCGGIPIIKSLREGFVANQFSAIYGIVNGTCNYILTRMKQEGAEFANVLADAQQQGYAETPPDLDIDGIDAQHKTGILASLAHGFWVDHHAIHTEGIREISKIDMQFAQQLGYTIKLLGIVKKVESRKQKAEKNSGVQVSVWIEIHAAARSFLHHQVRSMVGCLVLVGQGKWTAADLQAALEAKDRAALGFNAPPDGLYFVEALYPGIATSA